MADVKIRQLPDWVLDVWRTRAQSAGRSLEEELRTLLTEKAVERQRSFSDDVQAFRERLRARHGAMKDSTPAIVRDRLARG